MPYVPPVTFANGTALAAADLESDLAAAHAFVEGGIAAADLGAKWAKKEHFCNPSYYGLLNVMNFVSGTEFHRQIKSQIVTGAGCPETPFVAVGFRIFSDSTLLITWDLTTYSASDAGAPAPGATHIQLYLDGVQYGKSPNWGVEETPAGLASVSVRRNLSGFATYQKLKPGWHWVELRGISSTVRSCIALQGNLLGQAWTE